MKFCNLFTRIPAVIGMIHVKPLPGTPLYKGDFKKVLDDVRRETEIYLNAGVDGLLIENTHDVPYTNKVVGPEIVASMTMVGQAVRDLSESVVCGIQILAGCNKEAIAVAKACSLNFIRAEGFVFSHIADEGVIHADAGSLLRYRKMVGADDVMIFTDIKKKHSSHAITNDVSLLETAKAVEFFLGDGVVLTGSATGETASPSELCELLKFSGLPVLIGSGITLENFREYKLAHGLIVGSHFKDGNQWMNELNFEKVTSFMKVLRNET